MATPPTPSQSADTLCTHGSILVDRFSILTPCRGLAALLVLLVHAFGHFSLQPSTHWTLRVASSVTHWGFVGVDMFFVISGYCIAASLLKHATQSHSAVHFMVDRCLRVYPVFWVIFVAAVTANVFKNLLAGRDWALSVPESVTDWLAHLSLLDLYFSKPPAMDVTWTLTHELSFYATGAVCLAMWKRKWLRIGVPLLIGAGTLVSLLGYHQGALLIFQFLPQFLTGVIVFLAKSNRWSVASALGVLFVLVGAMWVLHPIDNNGDTRVEILAGWGMQSRLTLSAGFAALLVLYRQPSITRPASRLEEFLAWVGKISYSLYLVHVPILSPLMIGAGRVCPQESLFQWMIPVFGIMAALVAGALTHHYIEKRTERWRQAWQTTVKVKHA